MSFWIMGYKFIMIEDISKNVAANDESRPTERVINKFKEYYRNDLDYQYINVIPGMAKGFMNFIKTIRSMRVSGDRYNWSPGRYRHLQELIAKNCLRQAQNEIISLSMRGSGLLT